MACPDENAICEYVEGVMPEDKTRELERHLDRCASCRQLVAHTVRVFGQAEGAESATPGAVVMDEQPGRYNTRGEQGRGGQARVLIVHDRFMDREVAMKVLDPFEISGSSDRERAQRAAEQRARFLREVQLAGQLDHPSVVNIHELGRRPDGQLYYTMQYVRGETLSEALSKAKTFEERMRLLPHLVDCCNAVAYAHSRGVLHRDLKPSNIMIGEFGETVILDWGLASRRGEDGAGGAAPSDSGPAQTQDGMFIGTPSYMSPEQARGEVRDIDERSDVWGLGALLFEVVTGRPPFQGRSPLEIIRKVTDEPVPRAQDLCPAAPPELSAVVARALERDPARRYTSTRDLAADVAAFLAGGRVQAHRYSAWDVVRRFAVRHRLFLTAATLVFAAVVVALVVVTLSYHAQREALRQSSYHLAQAYGDRAARLLASDRLLEARVYAAAALARNPAHPGCPLHSTDFSTRTPQAADLVLRGSSITHQAGQRVLDRVEVVIAVGRPVRGLAMIDAESAVVTGDGGGRIACWRARDGARLWSRDGHAGEVLDLAVSPRGRMIASAGHDGTVRLWGTRRGAPIRSLRGHRGRANAVAFSPDGKLLASAGQDGAVRLWDPASGRALRSIAGHRVGALTVAFSADGSRLASAGVDRAVRIWNVSDGAALAHLTGHESLVLDLALARDGGTVSTSLDGTIRLWDSATHAPARKVLRRSKEVFFGVAFGPRGSLLAAASMNGFVHFWDPRSGSHLSAVKAHSERVYRVAFSADGALLASAGGDGDVRIWRVKKRSRPRFLEGHTATVMSVSFSPDGDRIASAGGREIRIWSAATGELLRSLPGHDADVTQVAYSSRGRLASASIDETVKIWEPGSGRLLRTLAGHRRGATSVSFSPDGGQLATGSVDHGIRLWDVESGELQATLAGHRSGVWDLSISADGSRLASASYDATVGVWGLREKKLRRRLKGHRGWVSAAAFSTGGLLATAGRDGQIVIWRSGARLRRLSGHRQWVRVARFSRDGRYLVTGGDDRTVRVWSTVDWQPVLLVEASSAVAGLSIAPDGRTLAYADGTRVGLMELEPLARPRDPLQLLEQARRAAGLDLRGYELVLRASNPRR